MDVFQKPFTVVPFQVADETFFTPYKVIGNLEGRTRRPLIVVHGGPSLSSDYLFPIADLADSGVPVIFYDQLG
jgi:pimeloyl-ACP methyl ester carboxylesterase